MMRNNEKKSVSRSKKLAWVCSFLAYIFIMLLLFAAKDFIVTAVTDKDVYEVKNVQIDTVTNGQEIWALFKNGEYMKDIDINEYSLMDGDGNTDYKYCALIEDARGLVYSLILCGMLVLVILIVNSSADGTPFVKKNVRRIYAIGWLQLALAAVPGLVVFLMKFFKFEYTSLHFTMNSVYMFLIAYVIMLLAKVFDYGVTLQEDSDSIA